MTNDSPHHDGYYSSDEAEEAERAGMLILGERESGPIPRSSRPPARPPEDLLGL